MNLATLRAELYDRGFDYLSTQRANYFLNRAYQDVAGQEDWPFLESSASGTTPLAISDLRSIESVYDTTSQTKLIPQSRKGITDYDVLSTSGTPCSYYTTQTINVNVFPTSTTDTITVRYYRNPDDLVGDSDAPLVPSRFQLGAIVDGALVFAYQDSDNFLAAQQMLSMWESTVESMRVQLVDAQHDRPDEFILLTDAW